jgi:hypothetical protein
MRNHFLRAIQKTSAPVTDPNFKQVALLLHGDGTNGSQNNTFVDSSTNNFSITRNGNTAQGTFSPFSLPDGQWSNFFDGTGDYLSVANNSSFQLGSGDFTIEAWVYPVAVPSSAGAAGNIISLYNTATNARSWALQLFSSGSTTQCNIRFGVSTDGTSTNLTTFTGGTVTINNWHHVVAVRSGSTITVYLNGVSVVSGSYSSSLFNSTVDLTIGRFANDVSTIPAGYISNARVVKGTAVYTSDFTPPTTPLTAIANTSLLTCQSNRFVDNSSNNVAITRNGDVRVTAFSPFAPTSAYSTSVVGGSGFFDGTGDYLTAPDNTALEVPTEDFTVEFWAYYTALPTSGNNANTFQKGVASSSTFEYAFGITNSSGTIRVRAGYSTNGSTTTSFVATSGTIVTNTWYHIAFTRTGTTLNLWLDGVNVGSTTSYPTTLFTGTGTLGIGAAPNNASLVNGYISNARIVKGSVLYTADFTPPTAPLTNITNTSLLLNFTNAGIFDNAGENVIETVGNAQIDTTVKKYGTGSLEFDGNGDWLVCPNRNSIPVGRATFTIEGWINFGSSANKKCIAAWGTATTNQFVSFLVNAAGNGLDFTFWNNDLASGNIGLSQNTWYHVAAQYDGTTRRIFVDGVQVATDTTTALSVPVSTTIIRVGANGTGAPEAFIGYIDDLRITNGVARYTSAGFTPPTEPYPDL